VKDDEDNVPVFVHAYIAQHLLCQVIQLLYNVHRKQQTFSPFKTSISANADGPRDAASLKINYRSAHRVQLPGNEHRSIVNCYTDREMSVISTYLNNNAQTPLGPFVVDILYNQVCNKCSVKSN